MGQKIQLGTKKQQIGVVNVFEPTTVDDKIKTIRSEIECLLLGLRNIERKQKRSVDPLTNLNKDGIPIGLIVEGITSKDPFNTYYLTVNKDNYNCGVNIFDSLSAAAEYVSKVRRSGWTFWKLPNGQTLKECFGK